MFANLILRIGPEILRLFNLILFNPHRTAHLAFNREIKPSLIELQKKCEQRNDYIMDYVKAVKNVRIGGIGYIGVKVKEWNKYIFPNAKFIWHVITVENSSANMRVSACSYHDSTTNAKPCFMIKGFLSNFLDSKNLRSSIFSQIFSSTALVRV